MDAPIVLFIMGCAACFISGISVGIALESLRRSRKS